MDIFLQKAFEGACLHRNNVRRPTPLSCSDNALTRRVVLALLFFTRQTMFVRLDCLCAAVRPPAGTSTRQQRSRGQRVLLPALRSASRNGWSR